MRKKQAGIITAAVIGFLGGLIVWGIFSFQFKEAQEQLVHNAKLSLSQELTDKAALETEWKSKKSFFLSDHDSSELLNAWLKEFINYAQLNSLKIDKLEPAGTKGSADEKEIAVFISFQSDMRKFNEFIYFLSEKDPLAAIQSVFIRRDDNSKNLSFELMLTKALA